MAFEHSRHIAASPEAVYTAFTDPARLARWWGPAGFTNTFESCDFRVGGHWKFTMHGPNGSDFRNEQRFAVIEPNRRIVLQHLSKPHYELTITLDAERGGTRVGWVQVFEDARFEPAMRDVISVANEQNLDRLAAEVARVNP